MNQRIKIATLTTLTAAMGVGLWWSRTSAPQVQDGALPPEAEWTAGHSRTYQFAWTLDQSVKLGSAELDADVSLRGEIELTSQTRTPEGDSVLVRLRALDPSSHYRVLDKNLLDASSQEGWLSAEALATFDRKGCLRSLRSLSDDEVQRIVLDGVVRTAQLCRRNRETDLLGQATLTWSRDEATWTRKARDYESLQGFDRVRASDVRTSGQDTVVLSAKKRLERLSGTRSLTWHGASDKSIQSRRSIDWTLIETKEKTPRLASTPSPVPTPQAAGVARRERLNRSLLESRAAGLTGRQLVTDLHRMSRLEQPQIDSRWLWRAGATLVLEPNAADSVGDLVLEPSSSVRGRELGVDLLSQTGTEHSQAVLLRVLDDSGLKIDPAYPRYMQRIGFVQEPSRETFAWAEAQTKSQDDDVRRAALHSLGALTGALDRVAAASDSSPKSEQDALRAMVERGITRLREVYQANSIDDRRAAIAGMGNARLEALEPDLLTATQDDSHDVRASAATALRDFESTQVMSRLCELLDDENTTVQRRAMRSLLGHDLSPTLQERVASTAEQRKSARANDAVLVTLAARKLSGDAKRRALEAVIARNPDDARIRARARHILRSASL